MHIFAEYVKHRVFMAYKQLSMEEKAIIKLLYAEGRSYHAISKEHNRSPHTIKKYLSEPQTQNEVAVKKQELADMYENMARKMVESITDENIKKINAYQRIVSSGICTDKMRLLRDQSTENIDLRTLHLSLEELKRQEQELLKIIGEKEEVAEVDTQDIVTEEKVKEY